MSHSSIVLRYYILYASLDTSLSDTDGRAHNVLCTLETPLWRTICAIPPHAAQSQQLSVLGTGCFLPLISVSIFFIGADILPLGDVSHPQPASQPANACLLQMPAWEMDRQCLEGKPPSPQILSKGASDQQ